MAKEGIAARVWAALGCALALWSVAPLAARAQLSGYSGRAAIAGDAHRHAGSAESERAYGADPPQCPHESGLGAALWTRGRAAGLDWLSLSYHDYLLAGDPNHPAYRYWTDPASAPRVDPLFSYTVTPSVPGFQDWLFGDVVSPPWNESASLASAAELANAPGTFIAIAGREFTADVFLGRLNHKVVIPRGPLDRICGYQSTQGRRHRCASETELYRLIASRGGALIQAHPGPFTPHQAPWHPVNEPRGISDAFVQGIEVGNASGGLQWEHGYRNALDAGYRFFPAFGSDTHSMSSGVAGCGDGSAPTLASGATLCWVPSAGWGREALVDAMRERACYFARAYEPLLQVEACATSATSGAGAPCLAPSVRMGGMVDAPGHNLRVRVFARNDQRNQPAADRRLARVELVGNAGEVLASCTDCCVAGSGLLPDTCNVDLVVAGVPDGALYARVCSAGAGATCGQNGSATVLVGAPVLVNWAAHRASLGLPGVDTCDFDADGRACYADNCWTTANPDQANADGDLYGDACDVWPEDPENDEDWDYVPYPIDRCPFHADAANGDADADGVGDACDACPATSDPLQADLDRDGSGDACDVCPSTPDREQRDADGDGLGDACDPDADDDGRANALDNCPLHANPLQTDTNLDGVGDACDADADGVAEESDLCPSIHDPAQLDGDLDGAGDACDSCVLVANPRLTPAPARSTTGGQLDDDADGFGNACDADFDGDLDVDAADAALFATGFDPASALYRRVGDLTCGPAQASACDVFDLDGSGSWVTATDQARLQARMGAPPGPRCAACGSDLVKLPCTGDACPDADGDGVDDRADVCPSLADPLQADADGDGVGDLCDNCVVVANPRPALVPSYALLTGGQRDDDADGWGNLCDADFDGPPPGVGPTDLQLMRNAMGRSAASATCGPTQASPCAAYDLDEVGATIGVGDLSVLRRLLGTTLSDTHRCPTCPLECSAGSARSCSLP